MKSIENCKHVISISLGSSTRDAQAILRWATGELL